MEEIENLRKELDALSDRLQEMQSILPGQILKDQARDENGRFAGGDGSGAGGQRASMAHKDASNRASSAARKLATEAGGKGSRRDVVAAANRLASAHNSAANSTTGDLRQKHLDAAASAKTVATQANHAFTDQAVRSAAGLAVDASGRATAASNEAWMNTFRG